MAEALANQALDSVAINGAPQLFLGDRQTEPGALPPIRPREHRKHGIAAADWLLEHALEGACFQKAGGARKPLRRQGAQDQGVRRTRPLARRALITLRPPKVAMRARKPWVRARFRVLG